MNKTYISYPLKKILTMLACLCFSFNALAEMNETQPIHIKADEMHFDLSSNSSSYIGNVIIKKGGIQLTGDQVEIIQVNNIVSKISATGHPAKFIQTDQSGNSVNAQSKQLEYFAIEERLIMKGDAKLIHNDQIIESNLISFDTKKRSLIAGSQSNQTGSPQRVKMTLTPTIK